MGFTFSQRSKSGFGFRTSNPLLLPIIGMVMVCWWMCLLCAWLFVKMALVCAWLFVKLAWLYWQLFRWPARWIVMGVKAMRQRRAGLQRS